MPMTASPSTPGKTWLDLIVGAPDAVSRRGEPVTCGGPLPRSLLRDTASLRMEDCQHQPVPFQARIIDIWPDGSARWLLLDWQADVVGSAAYRLHWSSEQGVRPAAECSLSVTRI